MEAQTSLHYSPKISLVFRILATVRDIFSVIINENYFINQEYFAFYYFFYFILSISICFQVMYNYFCGMLFN